MIEKATHIVGKNNLAHGWDVYLSSKDKVRWFVFHITWPMVGPRVNIRIMRVFKDKDTDELKWICPRLKDKPHNVGWPPELNREILQAISYCGPSEDGLSQLTTEDDLDKAFDDVGG